MAAAAATDMAVFALLLGAAAAAMPRGSQPSQPEAMVVSADDVKNMHELDVKRRNTSWYTRRVPQHIQNRSSIKKLGRALPAGNLHGNCGEQVPADSLGLKRSALAENFFEKMNLFQTTARTQLRGSRSNHPGVDSLAKPGVGVEQTRADNGRSLSGKVSGKDPYVTVLKDGWFYVGCYTDAMLEFGDKYGKNKYKYKMGGIDGGNVSIARYSELVLKQKQEKMTPQICYEFCRTVPGAVFFGISAGRECYCTPWFEPMPSDDKVCTATCEGDDLKICGSTAGKSSIWEMHLCADAETDLRNSMEEAKNALDFFFENVLLANDLGKRMSASAEKLEEVGGVAGSTTAADNARFANGASKVLAQAYMKGSDDYMQLRLNYGDGLFLSDKDFTDAETLTRVERTIDATEPLSSKVVGFASDVHLLNELAYTPTDEVVFGDAPESVDVVVDTAATALAEVMRAQEEKRDISSTLGSGLFRDVSYAFGTTTKPEASSCSGEVIKAPLMGLGLDGCAVVCQAQPACHAFAFYAMAGASDICFMLSEITAAEAFSCEGDAQATGSPAGGRCMVKMADMATGYKPKTGALTSYPRCFSTEKNYNLNVDVEKLKLPSASEIKVGSGSPLKKAD